MHKRRNLKLAGIFAVNPNRRVFDVFVKRRNDPIEHVGEEKQHVFQFIGDRHALRRVFVSLPAGGDLETNVREVRLGLLRRHRRIQHVDQAPDDALFLAQDRAPRRLGRVGGEYRFDAQHVENLLHRVRGRSRRLSALAACLRSRLAGSGRHRAGARDGGECDALSRRCWSSGSR